MFDKCKYALEIMRSHGEPDSSFGKVRDAIYNRGPMQRDAAGNETSFAFKAPNYLAAGVHAADHIDMLWISERLEDEDRVDGAIAQLEYALRIFRGFTGTHSRQDNPEAFDAAAEAYAFDLALLGALGEDTPPELPLTRCGSAHWLTDEEVAATVPPSSCA